MNNLHIANTIQKKLSLHYSAPTAPVSCAFITGWQSEWSDANKWSTAQIVAFEPCYNQLAIILLMILVPRKIVMT